MSRGGGGLVLIGGEAGIGKTRLAEELAERARARGAPVYWGRCWESEGAPAFWPWVQVVRACIRDRDPQTLRADMGPGAADVAQVVPEVGERLPGLPPPPALAPEAARFRFFDSLTTFLTNVANRQPMVLILDDLHRADRPSLLLLQFLARELRRSGLLVLGTFRDTEIDRRHPLVPTLAELAREPSVDRLGLQGLAEPEAVDLIAPAARQAPPALLAGRIHRETRGNPLFIHEVVRMLVGEGRFERPPAATTWEVGLPPGLREVIAQRLDRLSETCIQLLTMAAVLGPEFDLRTLRLVGEIPGDALLEAIAEAEAARVIRAVPAAPGRFGFSHGLVREALYEEIPSARRIRLHRQIGEALERVYGAEVEAHLTELAHHFVQAAPAGDPDKALDYAVRAAEQAERLSAHEEAVAHYGRALAVLELEGSGLGGRRRELLLALGSAQAEAGDTVGARKTLRDAATLARQLGDAGRLARAALGLSAAGVEYWRVDWSLVGLLDEALGALGEGNLALRARVLSRLASSLYYSGETERWEALSREAVALAAPCRDAEQPPGMAGTLIMSPGRDMGALHPGEQHPAQPGEKGHQQASRDQPGRPAPGPRGADDEPGESERDDRSGHVPRDVPAERRRLLPLQVGAEDQGRARHHRRDEGSEDARRQVMAPQQVQRGRRGPDVGRQLQRVDLVVERPLPDVHFPLPPARPTAGSLRPAGGRRAISTGSSVPAWDGSAAPVIEELQHDAIELPGLLHMEMVGRPGDDHLPRAGDPGRQQLGDLEDFGQVQVAGQDERGRPDLGEPVEGGWVEWEHVRLVREEIALAPEVARGYLRHPRARPDPPARAFAAGHR
jgi:hypothetical protein